MARAPGGVPEWKAWNGRRNRGGSGRGARALRAPARGLRLARGVFEVVCESAPMRELFQRLARFARRRGAGGDPGESGTGKEVVARTLHVNSPRAEEAVRGGERGRAPGGAPRVRAVRPRQAARSPARTPTKRGPVRGRRRRHALPRRDRRAAAGAAAEAAARAPGGRGPPGGRARRRKQVDVRVVARHDRDLAELVQRGALPRGPLLPARRCSRCGCRRCASAPTTSSRWRAPSSPRADRAAKAFSPDAERLLAALPLARQRARASERGEVRRGARARRAIGPEQLPDELEAPRRRPPPLR